MISGKEAEQRLMYYLGKYDSIRYKIIRKYDEILSRLKSRYKDFQYIIDENRIDINPALISIIVMAVWFCIDNLPFYIHMYQKARGVDLDSVERRLRDRNYLIRNKFELVKNLIKSKNYDKAKEVLNEIESIINDYKNDVESFKNMLKQHKTYDIHLKIIDAYEDTLEYYEKLINKEHDKTKASELISTLNDLVNKAKENKVYRAYYKLRYKVRYLEYRKRYVDNYEDWMRKYLTRKMQRINERKRYYLNRVKMKLFRILDYFVRRYKDIAKHVIVTYSTQFDVLREYRQSRGF